MEVRDQIFCFEIARRSVGRAALHLGIDSMSEAALDVMADILLGYLNRAGRGLSHLVESSGRSSAHANILDALTACQLVASPAAQQMHLPDPSNEDIFGSSTTQMTLNTADWQGLAAFLFGPDWLEEKEEEDEPIANGIGGKRGPSATANAAEGSGDSQSGSKQGWIAPYLDEVPVFPQASDSCANPHPLPPHQGLSLHRQEEETDETKEADEQELKQIPDPIFFTSWGAVKKGPGKRRATEITEDSTPPPTKKLKFDDKVEKSTTSKGVMEEVANSAEPSTTNTDYSNIPSFYPPTPSTQLSSKEGRVVIDSKPPPLPIAATTSESTSQNGVRSSLVQLGQYWGSGWDTPSSSKAQLAVPVGRKDGEAQNTTIVPLGRASGSRVSKILEGSMDAAAMQ